MSNPLMSLSPEQQNRFAQEKLRQMHKDTCIWLSPYKDIIQLLQEILLCRKLVISAAIFCLVQLFFCHLYTNNNTYITVISDIVFWVLLADGLWVIATRDKRVQGKQNNERRRSLWRKRQKELQYMTLEDAIIKDATPLQVGELAPFEVVCLWLAKVIMLADNIQLALRHWSRMNPYLFAVVTGTFGLLCIVIGYFISGLFLMFLLANYLLLLPSFRYYDLISKINVFVDMHYPVLTRKVMGSYQYIKSILSPLADQEFTGIHLDPNKPMEDELPELPPTDLVDRGVSRPETINEEEEEEESEPNGQGYVHREVSMTLTPFDESIDPLQSMHSLTIPPGGFPSITSFFNEDSISLTPFPNPSSHRPHPSEATAPPQRESSNRNVHPLPKIIERDDSLSLEPFEHIDPMKDSFDNEQYGPLHSNKPEISEVPSPIPSAPLEPPPPYTDSSPYFDSPLLNSFKVPASSSTPSSRDQQQQQEEYGNSHLRKREKI